MTDPSETIMNQELVARDDVAGADVGAKDIADETATLRVRRRNRAVALVAIVLVVAFIAGRLTAPGSDPGGAHHHGHAHGPADGSEAGGDGAGEGASVEYVCPMHPQIRQPEFGTCPICYMDLVPIEAGAGGSDMPEVRLSENAAKLARVRTERIEPQPLVRRIDVFGRVGVNERAEADITARAGGRIERLFVNAVGERVRQGQLLARIYSPDLHAVQQTLLQARRSLEAAEADGSEARMRAARAGFEAARTDLRLRGVDARQIDAILEEGRARETLDVYATAAGTVRTRHVAQGDYVEAGQRILSLMALDTVWVQLEIFERDLAYVAAGQTVAVTVPALGNTSVEGRIDFIDPVVDETRRVARARVVVPNSSGALRPGMFVRGQVEAPLEGTPVSVPASSVLWTGKRSLVYRVETRDGEPVYVPVEVVLGPRVGDRYVIEEGVELGDRLVSQGAFRVDATLQVKGGPTMMSTTEAALAAERGPLPEVEVPAEGVEFDPPVLPEQLPDDVWYCDMGTVHWAQGEEGDGICPLCNMRLTHRSGEGGHDHDHEAHDHAGHDHDHDHADTKGGKR